ncbi:hypothetical protein TruAng_006987 [Truncatella angustata]|nr:hypothetical protein TruAng_006987 [Truncatella angustata]
MRHGILHRNRIMAIMVHRNLIAFPHSHNRRISHMDRPATLYRHSLLVLHYTPIKGIHINMVNLRSTLRHYRMDTDRVPAHLDPWLHHLLGFSRQILDSIQPSLLRITPDRSHDRYARDQWNDRREDRRNEYGSDQRRPPRDHSRDERWHDDRGRQGGRGRFDRRKHDRPYGERTTRNREPFRSHSRPGSETSNRSGSQKPALTLNSSAHTTPKQATPASAVALPRKPEEPSRPSEVEDVVVPVEIELSHEVAGPEEKPDVTDNVATTSETRNETSSEDDDDIRSDKGFLRELEVAFAERSVQHQADPIAEPLPGEYSEQIMLPPAFDVKGVKSKYITSANLDDFALSVRDTNQWNKYRNHPAFLPPGDVNIHNLGVYLRSIQKGQGIRHDKRGRHTHAQNHGRDQGRSQRFNNRGDKDQRYSGPFQRKRKWEERVDTISGHEAANSRNLGYHLQYPELFEQPPRQASPEPGEISDTPVSVVDARAWPILPLPPKDDSSQWSRSDPVYVDDHGRHQPILDQSRNYDDGHSKFDRPGAPLHSGGHSRSPHYTGWGHPSLSPRPHEHFEPSDSYQRRSASPKPLLDDLQSHIDRLCSGATSDNDRVISSKEQVNHTEDRSASQNVFVEMPPRRGSQASNSGGRPVSRDGLASRRSSLGNISQASDLGSPLTRIEAELLGLIGADGDDSDTDSLKRQQEDTTHKRKQRKKVHSVYEHDLAI